MSDADRLAEVIKHSPHSFRNIRAQTTLNFTDARFRMLVRDNPTRFKAVKFCNGKDDHGACKMPFRPGVMLIGR